MTSPLKKHFENRSELVEYIKKISPQTESEHNVSPIYGGQKAALKKRETINPKEYGKTRNYLTGKVSGLSPYIRHGVLTLNDIRNYALSKVDNLKETESFIQELTWRDFWQHLYEKHPEWMWNNIEPYKTGFQHEDYASNLPDDILNAQTETACINAFINRLIATGYLHNHARMYLAAYVIHFRRIQWQAGARWFLTHLLDGDVASNNLSWQWVASTFSNKPYFFNLENIQKYCDDNIDTSPERNTILNYSYEELEQRLFPHKQEINNG